MKRAILILTIVAIAINSSACQSNTDEQTTTSKTQTMTETTTTTTTTESTTPIPGDGEVYSPLNGTIITEEASQKRPLTVMMDNMNKARPQAGLIDADIIYEALVEGRITRYMAVFQSTMPQLIGPIRSARPYYLRLAMEYDAYYTHVGGSEQAKSEIKQFSIADIDGLAAGADTFWRKNHKPIPNNMYGSSESLLNWANRRSYRKDSTYDSWQFDEKCGSPDFRQFSQLTIVYREAKYQDDPFSYNIEFKYDEDSKRYLRFYNGIAHLDEVSKTQLRADSIIVQRAATRVIDSYGRLVIDVVGSGTGYYLYDGVIIPITWQKSSDRSRTRYYTEDGKELVMKRGKIWVQIVEKNFELIENEE